jgi:serine/threonine protein kinase
VILGVGAAGTLLYLRRNDRDDIPPANASGAESSPPEPPNKGAEGPPSSGSDNASEIKPTNSSKPSGLTASTGTDGPLSSGGGGPPKNVPRAPQLSVDYSALKEGEPIGSGGNADVRRAIAQAPEGDVPLAIKTPRIGSTLQRGQVEQILSEAETWDKLDDNDHIVEVVDYGANPVPWIAMEYMDAGHLGDRAGALESDQALWTALAVTKGVRHAHRHGVAHLDLKPENILFRTVENAWNLPKVADWGLSKHLLDHSKSVEGLTPEYAAPEQFSDEFGTPDDLTDVYQLGAVFYALFTGQPPYKGPPARTMHQVLEETPRPPSEIAAIPDGLDDVLLKALAKDKDQRYEDIVYLRDELKDLYERF